MEKEHRLLELLSRVSPANETGRQAALAHWRSCAKPLGSLGLLETALVRIAALTGSADIALSPRNVLVFCADNGVIAQGVTQTDASVTALVARSLPLGITPVCRMAAVAGCGVVPVDMGVKDFPGAKGVADRRVGNGTADITCGPAMSREQAAEAVLAGVETVRLEREKGTRLLATGEMGIGNTTTASCVAAALLGLEPETVTGRGAGLSDEGLEKKRRAVRRALEVNRPDPADPLGLLAGVGGFDIGAMCGAFIGGALYGVPVLVDGFISAAAALLAVRLCPNAGKALLASHVSAEPAGKMLLDALGLQPMITAGMRLGEGTGAVAAMPLLDMALAVYRESYTFEQAGMEAYVPLGGEACSPL